MHMYVGYVFMQKYAHVWLSAMMFNTLNARKYAKWEYLINIRKISQIYKELDTKPFWQAYCYLIEH